MSLWGAVWSSWCHCGPVGLLGCPVGLGGPVAWLAADRTVARLDTEYVTNRYTSAVRNESLHMDDSLASQTRGPSLSIRPDISVNISAIKAPIPHDPVEPTQGDAEPCIIPDRDGRTYRDRYPLRVVVTDSLALPSPCSPPSLSLLGCWRWLRGPSKGRNTKGESSTAITHRDRFCLVQSQQGLTTRIGKNREKG